MTQTWNLVRSLHGIRCRLHVSALVFFTLDQHPFKHAPSTTWRYSQFCDYWDDCSAVPYVGLQACEVHIASLALFGYAPDMFNRLAESLRKYPAYCYRMPKTVRGPRRRHLEPPISPPCHAGTHLTYEQRRRIYSLSHQSRTSQRSIASTLNLPRTTAQSAIYSMEEESSTQKKRVSIYKHGASQAVSTENSAELHTVCSMTTRAFDDRLVTAISQSPIPEPNQSSDQDRVRKYLDSSGAKSLLENIPAPDQVQFDDQDILHNAPPRRLLIGHHAETGDAVYAYILPSGASQKVVFSAEDTRGQPNVGISHRDVARQHIRYPFNKTFPQDGRCLGRADKARLAIVVRWYFIATGLTKLRSPKSLRTFCKQFRNALRYIANRSESAARRLPRNPSGQVDESDIQSALLATMLSPSPSPTMLAKESHRWPSLSLEPPGTESNTDVGGLPPSTATCRS